MGHQFVAKALILVVLLCWKADANNGTCATDDYTISIDDEPYFRIVRNDRTCRCETFVGQITSTAGAPTLQAQIAALNATVTSLLLNGGGGGGGGGAVPGLGAACANDTDCVYPYVCSASSLRCLGSNGVGCTLHTQCAYGLRCQSGVCLVANSTCPALEVENGYLTYTDNGNVGSIAAVTCINGFTPVPTASPQTCQANGQWSGSTTSCLNYNPCATDATVCAPGYCTSSTGDYTCVCPSGWVGTGTTRCSLHNSLPTAWPGGYINGGSQNPGYNNTNLVVCNYPATVSWKACVRLASQYGGMLEPINVLEGWKSHREMLPSLLAQYNINSNDQNYRVQDQSNAAGCYVCRDTRATRNDRPLSGTTTYQGQDWHFEDFGFMYYDECQLLAAEAGAMMITPATVGIATNVAYHINIHWPWTPPAYFNYIAGNRTFGSEQKAVGARSSIRACMVGFVDN